MANGIYGALGGVKSNIKARRQLQPEETMGTKKKTSGSSGGSYGLGGLSNGLPKKTKQGRYKGLAY